MVVWVEILGHLISIYTAHVGDDHDTHVIAYEGCMDCSRYVSHAILCLERCQTC